MPLTAFGEACHKHRIRMMKIIAEQSDRTGFPAYVISSVETGRMPLPPNYMSRVVEWMELTDAEANELRNLVSCDLKGKRNRGKNLRSLDQSLMQVLNQLQAMEVQSKAEEPADAKG